MSGVLIILYVSDQEASTAFYEHVLGRSPILNVPGMTEFRLDERCKLGLMPQQGMKKLLGDTMPDPARASGIPRVEIYLNVEEPERYLQRALASGARELSSMAYRDWGDHVGYCLDPDGHVLAFAGASNDNDS